MADDDLRESERARQKRAAPLSNNCQLVVRWQTRPEPITKPPGTGTPSQPQPAKGVARRPLGRRFAFSSPRARHQQCTSQPPHSSRPACGFPACFRGRDLRHSCQKIAKIVATKVPVYQASPARSQKRPGIGPVTRLSAHTPHLVLPESIPPCSMLAADTHTTFSTTPAEDSPS